MSWWTKTQAVSWIYVSAAMTGLARRCDKAAVWCAGRAAKLIPGMPTPPKL